MNNCFFSLGLMSGTSGDGIDASLIYSDGISGLDLIYDTYEEYPDEIYTKFHKLRDKIYTFEDIKRYKEEVREIERKITIFSYQVIEKIKDSLVKKKIKIDLIGFHGQTILHKPEDKITIQIGDGNYLSQITKTNVIYNFRLNDLNHGGQGAPLTPIFHKLIVDQKKIKTPVSILNIGGISNITSINAQNEISSSDIGPGNCLIDNWIRINSNKNYDNDGNIARSGKIDKLILNQTLENFYDNQVSKKKSYDTKDFDLSFVRGLNLNDGAATLTEFTAEICSNKIKKEDIFLCGGGRKNTFLVESIQSKIQGKLELIDKLNINGDFVESQAFAYLAIRSYLKKPITFPNTTGCIKPVTGGELASNF